MSPSMVPHMGIGAPNAMMGGGASQNHMMMPMASMASMTPSYGQSQMQQETQTITLTDQQVSQGGCRQWRGPQLSKKENSVTQSTAIKSGTQCLDWQSCHSDDAVARFYSIYASLMSSAASR